MNRIEELTFKFLDDVLTDAESSELENLLARDTASARFHVSLLEQEALLRSDRQPADLALPIVQRIQEEIRMRGEKGVMQKIRELPRPRQRIWSIPRSSARWFWLSPAMAALVLWAALVLYYFVPKHLNRDAGSALSATIVNLNGQVILESAPNQRTLRVGDSLTPGDSVTVGSGCALTLAYRDQTTVEFSGNTAFALATSGKEQEEGKVVRLTQGRLAATVAPQPIGQPMIFLTPRTEARVLGTRLLLAATADTTRLDVTEGRVKFTRMDAPVSWEVSTGGYVLTGTETTRSANAHRSSQDESLRVIEDHEGPLTWRQQPECAPLAFELSPVAQSGKNGLRIVYEPKAGDRWTYGEIDHTFTLKPGEHVLQFFINVEHYEGNANWTIQFRQRDRNCWMIAGGLLSDLGKGWNLIELEIPHTPANVWGGGTYRPNEIQELLFGVCQGAATFTIDDLAVSGGEQP